MSDVDLIIVSYQACSFMNKNKTGICETINAKLLIIFLHIGCFLKARIQGLSYLSKKRTRNLCNKLCDHNYTNNGNILRLCYVFMSWDMP